MLAPVCQPRYLRAHAQCLWRPGRLATCLCLQTTQRHIPSKQTCACAADRRMCSGTMHGMCSGKGAMTPMPVPCAATSRGRVPADGQDAGMAQVLTWLFNDGSSSIAGRDAVAEPQAMSVSSLLV